MGSIFSWFVTSEEDISKKVDDDLNEWMVSQYANCPYLTVIPRKRVEQKRKELREAYM